MKTTLKKTLSIIITILMIVTSVPFALAAGDGVPLTIDITDKSNVSIGNGKTYYDEDGYIITGTNKDLIVDVYEEGNFVFRNASFKSFWLNGGDYEVTITLEGDNYLATTEDHYCGISFGYQHLTIEGGENDTLNFNCKASAISTSGNPGTCTVNGGKINAVTETDQDYSTIRSFGGFIMNGGEVTLSNNYWDVVGCPVTLNGGVLNVIGTSTDCAAVNQKITVEKGALLTVSSACGIFSDWYVTNIVVADDAEENTLLFAKYNTEDEFAPVYDIKSALDGKTYAEIKADTHNHSFTNDECACGFICKHTDREDGFCTVCKRYIYAITHQPTSGEPYVELNNDTDASYQWYEVERRGSEITDENADTVVYDWGESSYDKETGWTGVAYEENITGQDFFTVALKAGETVIVELTGDFTEGVGLWDYNTNYGVLIEAEEGVSSYEITVGADGDYTFYTFVNSGVVTVKAYTGVTNYTAIEGEASAEIKNPEIGKRYVCEVTYGNGTTEMTDVLKYSYAITHQPTSEEPYVELSDDTDASYQWYTVEDDAEEITDENAKTSTGTYSAEYGWSPMIEASSSTQYYFSFDLKAGDKVTFEFSSVPEIIKFSDFIVRPEETTFSYVADLDRNCELIAHYDGTEITARAYLGDATYTAIEGENSAELKNADIGKNYACEVTFADGTTEMSDTFEVTNLHECDFTGEWKYDADKHWKECTCGETGEEAEHTYTDGKCECGYECPHEWGEGVLTRPIRITTTDWDDGYYTYTCSACGHYYHEAVKRADYTALDAILEDFIDAMYDTTLLDSIRNELEVIYFDNIKVLYGDYIESEQAEVDALVETMTQKLAEVEAGVADGSALKPDYTEGDALINGIIEQFYDKGITYVDEIIAEFDTLYNEYLAIWHKPETTKPQVDEIVEELKALKEKIDKGTEDGTLVKIDGMKEYNKIADALDAELMENYSQEEIATLAEKAGDEINARFGEIIEKAEALTGTVADNKDALAEIESELSALYAEMKNCLDGVHNGFVYEVTEEAKCEVNAIESATCTLCGETDEREVEGSALKHSFAKYEVTEEAECGKAGKEVASCDHGCGATNEKEIPALTHKDDDGDHLCDYGCGTQISDGAEGETGSPADDCDHLCHKDGILGFIWKIVQFFWKLFKMNPVCECGAAHY